MRLGPAFLGGRLLAGSHHREGRLPFRLLLPLAHLDRHGDGPDVAEGILEFAVSPSPELVLQREGWLRTRVQGLGPKFVDVFRVARRAIENSPRCKTGPTFKDDSRDAGAGLPFQPQAHEDLVDVRSANPDVSAADAFLDEAEGLVQPAGPVVRRKDREFRFL